MTRGLIYLAQEETPLEAARRQLRIAEEEALRKAAEQECREHEQEASKEAARRRKSTTEKLKAALKQYRLVILVSAGITMGATSDEH